MPDSRESPAAAQSPTIGPPSDALGWPRRGTPRGRALAQRLLGLVGWHIEGDMPNEPRFVLIVAPHTSNWDFPICVLAMLAIGLQASWLGKHTIFRLPVAGILRWLGGEPLDRSHHHGTVEVALDRFRTRRQWVLGVSPEGTRRRVEEWKTGFLHIAIGARVPVVPVTLDYRSRTLGIGRPVHPTGDVSADMITIRSLFTKEMALYPEQFAE